MASRIEAASVLIYSKMNPKMKRWSRDKLYDNINNKDQSSRDLPSFKYHDKLYLIWNFIKHNNSDTYESLKKIILMFYMMKNMWLELQQNTMLN